MNTITILAVPPCHKAISEYCSLRWRLPAPPKKESQKHLIQYCAVSEDAYEGIETRVQPINVERGIEKDSRKFGGMQLKL